MTKHYYRSGLTLVLLLLFVPVFSQDRGLIITDDPTYKILIMDTVFNTPKYAASREGFEAAEAEWPVVLRRLLNFGDETSWVKLRDERDEIGYRHITLKQYYRNIEVEGGIYKVHLRDGKLISFNGAFYNRLPENTAPALTVESALNKALHHIGAETYKWQDANEEALIKEIKADEQATWFPKGTLVFVSEKFELKPGSFRLAWRFEIHATEPLMAGRIFIDALNGSVVAEEDFIHIINASGIAVTKYSGTQPLTTDSVSPLVFRLRETGRGNGVETYNMKKGTSYGAAVDFLDSNNFWNNVNANQDEVATDAHWGAEMTYDYFWYSFSRNSYDNKGAKIRSYVHYSNNYNNAFWNGSVMTYGDGDGSTFTPLTAIDVCAHEITHAVTSNTANLVYSYESGALNESFSDIFGNTVEQYAKPAQFNWKLGEEITPSGNGLRNMADPNLRNHPDTYKGTLWYTGAGDNGGVHINSGVQNYWYYLLSDGDTGTNDINNKFSVDSIGIDKAAQIAYRNLSVYLTSNSKYADARFYAIQSSIDLYGNCSKEVIATTNAWYAVGVGPKYDSGVITANFISDTFYCKAPADVAFTNFSNNTVSYLWKFGDGDSSTQASPVHTYITYGTFSVDLIAKGCFVNLYDTMSKVAIITVDSTPDICRAYLMPYGKWATINICQGFVYDNGGEGPYKTLIRDTLTIAPFAADSIALQFSDFDYENKFDSVYIYNGPSPSSPLIGGYTGSTLPNGGNRIVSTGGAITLIHFSDPLLVGRGFKASVTVYRQPVKLLPMPDSLVCDLQPIKLFVHPSGGFPDDYLYRWNKIYNQDSILTTALRRDTTYEIELIDVCNNKRDTANIKITVRPVLQLTTFKDTTICNGTMASLSAIPKGGLPSGYSYTWNNIPGTSTQNPVLSASTSFKVVLADGCTGYSDSQQVSVTVLPALTLNVSNDTLICFGTPANLKSFASGGNGNYTFTWNQGLPKLANQTVYPTARTLYTIVLSDGCSAVLPLDSILILVRDKLRVSLPTDTVICFGQSLNLQAAITGGDTINRKILWGGGQSVPSILVQPDTATNYTIRVFDNCSNPESRDTIMVSARGPLNVSLPANDTLCVGNSKWLNTLASGGNPSAYFFRWENGFGPGDKIIVNPVTTTTFTVILNDGCSVPEDTADVTIFVRPPLSLKTSGDTSVCEGDTINIQAFGSGGVRSGYQFDWGSSLGKGAVQSIIGTTTKWYKVTFNDGCSDYAFDSLLMTVKLSPQTNFLINDNPICTYKDVSFQNLTPLSGSETILWDFGDGNTSTEVDPIRQYADSGWFTIKLSITNSFNCTRSKTEPSILEVVAMPRPSFDANAYVLPINAPKALLQNTSLFATNYLWDFGDGNSSADISPEHTFTDTGTYFISLVASNRIGCDSTFVSGFRVKPIFNLYIPTAFTPNEDGNNDHFVPVGTAIKTYDLILFNRWGEIIFSSLNPKITWDGKNSDGEAALQGNYFYRLSVIDTDGLRHLYSGAVLLMR
jgi:gliding motility-associated-like protein